MTMFARLTQRLLRVAADQRGTTVIETALVVPVLACMALGAYDASQIVSRQHELQNGAADAEQIVLAAAGAATSTTTMKQVLSNTLGIPLANIDVDQLYRCNNTTTLQTTTCTSGSWEADYVRVTFRTSYTPTWTSFGIGSTVNYNVVRQVQYQQVQR
jgi:Flp pilus assembly protein TadG